MARDEDISFKAVATVADVARLVRLSRERFYQLQREGVFPMPVYDPITRRPFYLEEQQRQCVEVRRRNCGVNGRPVLFYSRGPAPVRPASPRRRTAAGVAASSNGDDQLVEAIRALGLTATAAEVTEAKQACFPTGAGGGDMGNVIRTVFLHLKRQNPADNAGR